MFVFLLLGVLKNTGGPKQNRSEKTCNLSLHTYGNHSILTSFSATNDLKAKPKFCSFYSKPVFCVFLLLCESRAIKFLNMPSSIKAINIYWELLSFLNENKILSYFFKKNIFIWLCCSDQFDVCLEEWDTLSRQYDKVFFCVKRKFSFFS